MTFVAPDFTATDALFLKTTQLRRLGNTSHTDIKKSAYLLLMTSNEDSQKS